MNNRIHGQVRIPKTTTAVLKQVKNDIKTTLKKSDKREKDVKFRLIKA